MANNHIGTAFEILKDVAGDLNWNYSHGDIDPNKSKLIYPLVHTTLGPMQVGKQITIVQINVMVADVMNYLKTENQEDSLATKYNLMGYSENQNYASILQELYVKFCKSLYKIQYNRYEEFKFQLPITFNPFIEGSTDVLAGFTIILNLEIQSPWVTDGRC